MVLDLEKQQQLHGPDDRSRATLEGGRWDIVRSSGTNLSMSCYLILEPHRSEGSEHGMNRQNRQHNALYS